MDFKAKPTAPTTIATDNDNILATKGYVDTKISEGSTPLYNGLDSSSTTAALTAAQGRQLELNKVSKAGDNMTGNLGIHVATPNEALDIQGNIRVRQENSIKFGGSGANDAAFEIVFNSSTNSLDFNCLL